jgi:protein-S-isoprenylcysteine O-methyltransferase Ste14
MELKGFNELVRHMPDLNSTGGRAKLVLLFAGIFTLTTIYFIITDQIPTWTLDSQIVIMALGYLFLSRFFTQRKNFIEKHKDIAYRHAFVRFVIPGLAVIFAAMAHIAYMNGPKFTQPTITTILSILGWLLIIVGVVLWIRSVFAFGLDYLTMLYVYHPAEGRIVNSNIYNILRHPVYAGALRIGIGLACLNMGVYALTFALLLPLGVTGWVRLVEEKELLERFPGYAEYRKRTPAFWPQINKLPAFFNFLFTGK